MNTDTRLIVLTQGKSTIVDACDYEFVTQWKWYVHRVEKKHGVIWYARRRNWPEGKTIYLHREIALRAGLPYSPRYDHHDHNGLNNTRRNVRACTQSQNNANRRKSLGTSSKYKGVYFEKSEGRWYAQIKVARTKKHLGIFDSEVDAAIAYDAAARKYYGQFACINF